MRFRKTIYSFFVWFILICFAQCKKENTTSGKNITLTGKSLTEVKMIIKGDWFVVRSTACGFAGCGTSYNDVATANIMSFLPDDKLKETAHTGTPVYHDEKADSIKYGLTAYAD